MKKTIFSRISALALTIVLAGAMTKTAQAQDKPEKAATSKLAGIELPQGAVRLREGSEPQSVAKALEGFVHAYDAEATQGKTEVLVWAGDAYDKDNADSLMEETGATMLGAGWNYESIKDETRPASVVRASKSGRNPKTLVGCWVSTDQMLILAWSEVKSAATETEDKNAEDQVSNSITEDILPSPRSTSHPSSSHQSSAKDETASEPTSSKTSTGKVPADMVGKWSWTTISGLNYVDPTHGNITDNAGGMSVTVTFDKNGHYTFFLYFRQRTYALVTEATTTHEGTASVAGGKITMKITKGHYRGSSTTGQVVDRPMTADEKQKNNAFYYKWVQKDGKRQLMMGPSADSLSSFKRVG